MSHDIPTQPPEDPAKPRKPRRNLHRKLKANGPPRYRTWWLHNTALNTELLGFLRKIRRPDGKLSRANLQAALAVATDLDRLLTAQVKRAADHTFGFANRVRILVDRREGRKRPKRDTPEGGG